MEIDEKFMSNKYDKYKQYILKKLGFDYRQQSDSVRHDIDSWIRDYYVDGMSEYDCIQAIQDQIDYPLHQKIGATYLVSRAPINPDSIIVIQSIPLPQ